MNVKSRTFLTSVSNGRTELVSIPSDPTIALASKPTVLFGTKLFI